MTQLESKVKKQMHDYIESRGGYYALVPQGSYSIPGDPDMIICYRGRFIGCEAKTPSGSLRDDQKERAEDIRQAGGVWICARDIDSIARTFDAIDAEIEGMKE